MLHVPVPLPFCLPSIKDRQRQRRRHGKKKEAFVSLVQKDTNACMVLINGSVAYFSLSFDSPSVFGLAIDFSSGEATEVRGLRNLLRSSCLGRGTR